MRIDHFAINELEALSLIDKAMAILTDVQGIAKKIIEEKSNVIESFEMPFQSAFEEFFEKDGKPMKEEGQSSYLSMVKNPLLRQVVSDFSLGNKKSGRKELIFQQAFNQYEQIVDSKFSKEEAGQPFDLTGYIEDSQTNEKIKDIVEFIYIYRYNTKDTDKVLKFLNMVYLKKYGDGFLQKNMDIYKLIEEEIETLLAISQEERLKKIEDKIEASLYSTIEFYPVFYWFYALGRLDYLLDFIKMTSLPPLHRDFIVELMMKRSEMKSESEKIVGTITLAREMVKDVIQKINNKEVPVISKKVFEKLLNLGVKFFPGYFKKPVVKRIRTTVFNYMKEDKMKEVRT